MTGNKPSTAAGWIDPDDAPDLSAPEYQAKLAKTQVRRGRPKSASPKVRFGLRLAADVVASIRASGPGYNVRVEEALRAAGFGRAQGGGDSEEGMGEEGPSRAETAETKERRSMRGQNA
jgi:uncharacterized protein (DUF4415 family)